MIFEISSKFFLCENFRLGFVNELFKNINQSENKKKCRSGSVGYVLLASHQAWTNSRSNVHQNKQ